MPPPPPRFKGFLRLVILTSYSVKLVKIRKTLLSLSVLFAYDIIAANFTDWKAVVHCSFGGWFVYMLNLV